jgi:hypothetical protein
MVYIRVLLLFYLPFPEIYKQNQALIPQLVQNPKPSGRGPRRIFLNLLFSLIESSVPPQGIPHTHNSVSTGPYELSLRE